MNILSIGNSFSVDAHRYLHDIARADGEKMKTVALHIGGCSLNRHYRNMLADAPQYELVFNGLPTGFHVSMKQALLSDEWDVITLQQASPLSGRYDTYQPFAGELAAFVRKCVPHAQLIVHETWAYEQGCERLKNLGYARAEDMFSDVCECYKRMARDVNADGPIPSGTLFNVLSRKLEKIHRDTFHASFGAGRYALGLLWYKTLTGNPISDNAFCDFDEEVSEEEIKIIKDAVSNI